MFWLSDDGVGSWISADTFTVGFHFYHYPLLLSTMSTTTMSDSVEGSRKRHTNPSDVLSTEHTVVLRSIIQNLVVKWADEVRELYTVYDVSTSLHNMLSQQAQTFYSTFAGTNERQ